MATSAASSPAAALADGILRSTSIKLLVCASVLLPLAAGCGKSDAEGIALHPATGRVAFRGKPAPGAIVALHPKSETPAGTPNPRASVQQDGTFSLSTFHPGDGAPEGTYVVTVQWFKPVERHGDFGPGPNVLPKKYATPKSSKIEVKIAAGTNQLPDIELR